MIEAEASADTSQESDANYDDQDNVPSLQASLSRGNGVTDNWGHWAGVSGLGTCAVLVTGILVGENLKVGDSFDAIQVAEVHVGDSLSIARAQDQPVGRRGQLCR